MRLLNTETLVLEEFMGRPPPYAILSHTWGEEEVLFKDMEDGTARSKKGWLKIEGACKSALSQEHKYCWIDTCCIDKSSSAELSEAINSMYAYYRDAVLCYVYLDIKVVDSEITEFELRQTHWITRGWTLQELIAPTRVHLYDCQWEFCGSRTKLRNRLESVTGIDADLLRYPDVFELRSYNIATKMSWAARRTTTRPEDIAYCLFGIFQVNLAPLYGEGCAAAFRRLQEEIIKQSLDLSFLAWQRRRKHSTRHPPRYAKALASHPACFQDCVVYRTSSGINTYDVQSFHMTNKGLRLTLPLLLNPERTTINRGEYIMLLPSCSFENKSITEQCLGLYVREDDFFGKNTFTRVFDREPNAIEFSKSYLQMQRNGRSTWCNKCDCQILIKAISGARTIHCLVSAVWHT